MLFTNIQIHSTSTLCDLCVLSVYVVPNNGILLFCISKTYNSRKHDVRLLFGMTRLDIKQNKLKPVRYHRLSQFILMVLTGINSYFEAKTNEGFLMKIE